MKKPRKPYGRRRLSARTEPERLLIATTMEMKRIKKRVIPLKRRRTHKGDTLSPSELALLSEQIDHLTRKHAKLAKLHAYMLLKWQEKTLYAFTPKELRKAYCYEKLS